MNKNDETRTSLTENETFTQLSQTFTQVLAIAVPSLALLSMGMKDSFPAVVISVLSDQSNNSTLHFTTEEASWFGSLKYIMTPVGSLTSGALLQPIGCKSWMMLLNIPLIGGWLMAYFATSSTILYASAALSGFASGLMEAPTVRYASEVSHPSLRGILMSAMYIFYPIGNFFIYFLSAVTDWRQVALIGAIIPIISTISLLLVPETPMWLMSKGRPEDALKSLQWLRGWTSPEVVKEEYKKLEFYSNKTSRTLSSLKKRAGGHYDKIETIEENSLGGKTVKLSDEDQQKQNDPKKVRRDLTSREILALVIKCIILFVLSVFSTRMGMNPYNLQIYSQLHLPIDANTTAMILALIGVAGIVILLFLLNRTGKKALTIFSFTTSSVCLSLIGVYAMLPTLILEQDSSFLRWSALVLFITNTFAVTIGIQSVLGVYLGEILPYRGRGITTGIVKSLFYITIFVLTKTFPAMEQQLGLQGIFFVCGMFSVVGALFTYSYLPETDGKFLSDIEIEYSSATSVGYTA